MKMSSMSEQAGREQSFYAKKGAVQRPRGRNQLGRLRTLQVPIAE